MINMKKENMRLYRRIDELRQDQGSLETQVEKLQEELAAEYLRYRYAKSILDICSFCTCCVY